MTPSSRHGRTVPRYFVQGLAVNAALLAVFALLTGVAPDVPIWVRSLVASLAIMPLSFLLNQRWVFNADRGRTATHLWRFGVVYLGWALFGAWTITAVSTLLIPNPIVAQIVTMLVVAVMGYLLHSLWTFGGGESHA